MKIFFGKIKATADDTQIKGAYYQTISPMKLGEIKTGDYAFIISGRKIHLWKGKERIDLEGNTKMTFDVIQENLPLNSKMFVALKYFKLYTSLIVLTIRQSPKAFYPIALADETLTEAVLTNPDTYKDLQNFRSIRILKSPNEVNVESKDIQLYYNEKGSLEVYKASFFDSALFANFTDNLSRAGGGCKQKDKALEKIKLGKISSLTYDFEQLPILRMYDAVFAQYGAEEEPDFPSDDTPDAQDDAAPMELKSYNQIYYGPPRYW